MYIQVKRLYLIVTHNDDNCVYIWTQKIIVYLGFCFAAYLLDIPHVSFIF